MAPKKLCTKCKYSKGLINGLKCDHPTSDHSPVDGSPTSTCIQHLYHPFANGSIPSRAAVDVPIDPVDRSK